MLTVRQERHQVLINFISYILTAIPGIIDLVLYIEDMKARRGCQLPWVLRQSRTLGQKQWEKK